MVMRFAVDGRSYRLRFQHAQWDRATALSTKSNGFTRCSIWEEKERKAVACMSVSVSVCSLKDNFNKKIGREVALGRLLKKLPVEFHDPIRNAYEGRS